MGKLYENKHFWQKKGPNRGPGHPLQMIQWGSTTSWLINANQRKVYARKKNKLLNRFWEIMTKGVKIVIF